MFPPIFARAAASPAVTALLGATPVRFYLFGEATQATARPYAVWQTISGSPENYLNQTPDVDNFSTQIDAYGLTAASARAVAKALRDAFEGSAYVTFYNGESKETDTNLYRYSFTVDWIVDR